MNDKPQIVHVEIGGVSTLARLTLWYYVAKFTFAAVKITLKYLIAAVAAVLAGVLLAWGFTSPPRPYGLDLLDEYLEPLAARIGRIQPPPQQLHQPPQNGPGAGGGGPE